MKLLRKITPFLLIAVMVMLAACASSVASGGVAQNSNDRSDIVEFTEIIEDEDGTPEDSSVKEDVTDVKTEDVESADAGTDTVEAIDVSTEDANADNVSTEDVNADNVSTEDVNADESAIDPEAYYYDLESVVLYLETYGELPLNYITKDEAKKRGWEGGSVEDYIPDAAIGGDYFGNFEKQLPAEKGVKYTECDLDTHGYKNRGSRRLIFSNDGRYFYTRDHYETFKEVIITDSGIELVDY